MFRPFQHIASTGLALLLLLSGISFTTGVWAQTNPRTQSSDDKPVNPVDDPDDRKNNTDSGITRDNCLVGENPKPLTALIPNSSGYPLTTMGYPTFFFYIPDNALEAVEFLILDDESRLLYRNRMAISPRGGVMSVSLPTDSPMGELQPGKSYQWELALVCQKNGKEDKTTHLNGWIQRVDNPDLVAQVQQANPRQVPEIYAQAGIWYDFLASLANLRRENPNDSELTQYWIEVLQSVGLAEVAEEPLISQP